MMRKAIALLLVLLALSGCCACGTKQGGDGTTGDVQTTIAPDDETTQKQQETEAVTTAAQTVIEDKTTISLDGKNIMFVGNSFTYYGNCVIKGTEDSTAGNSYFKQVAKSYGDSVTVNNFTYGDHSLSDTEKGLYEKMLALHPNYYNNPDGKPMDSFYDQDYLILQESGSDRSNTYAASKKIMEMFPEKTKFCFYATTYAVIKNHTNVLNTGKWLRDRNGLMYLPVGQLCCDLWQQNIKIEGSVLTYNKNSFIVSRTDKDGYHPNNLTGYVTALLTYCAITGKSAVGADRAFVSTSMEFYTVGKSNYDKILASDVDMAGIQKLIDSYIAEYNN